MKKLYLLLITCILCMHGLRAQYFIADVTLDNNQAVFSVIPRGGDITNKFIVVEFYVRWPQFQVGPNDFAFTTVTNHITNFPGMDMLTAYNDVPDAGYNNEHFYFVGLNGTNTYLQDVSYEVFRCDWTGTFPVGFELVADNTTGDPYYFTIQGLGGFAFDYTPTGVNPFVNGINVVDDFWRRPFPSSILPVNLKSFTGNADGCNANLRWTTGNAVSDKLFEVQHSSNGLNFTTVATVAAPRKNNGDCSYSKQVALTADMNYYRLKMTSLDNKISYSNIVKLDNKTCRNISGIAVQVYPNPVENHEIKMNVDVKTSDKILVTVMDMSGKLIGQYNRQVTAGQNAVQVKLPQIASSQYVMQVRSSNNGKTEQKIFLK